MTEEMINEQIIFYTQQLDSFDQFSTNYVMTVIGFVGVIAAAIMAMMGARKWRTDKSAVLDIGEEDSLKYGNIILNRAISMAFLTYPGIMTLFMYVFAINCRKVALYRGYLMYLEDLLASKQGSNAYEAMFNKKSLEIAYGVSGFNVTGPKEFFGESFFSMTYGPIVMGIFIVVLFAASFIISMYFAGQADGSYRLKKREIVIDRNGQEREKTICCWSEWGKYKHWYLPIFWVLVIVSVLFCTVCFLDLVNNDAAMEIFHNALNSAAGI